MKKRFVKYLSSMVAMAMVAGTLALTGCGDNNSDSKPDADQEQQVEDKDDADKDDQGNGDSQGAGDQASAYDSAVAILNAFWENGSYDFPVYGGNFDNVVDNAPGTLPTSDVDTMTNMLLIPEDVQGCVADAATLFHMMNSNTFTGAALKLNGMSSEEAAGKIKEAFKNNQFMCGIPDKIMIYTVGNDLVFFYGATDILDMFADAAASVEGAVLVVDENY